MAVGVTDRWHKSRPVAGEPTCKEHDQVPTTSHGKGERWQVRWDEWKNGKRHQPRRNFRYKVGKDPDVHADAFAANLQSLPPPVERSKFDITVSEVADAWLASRDIADSTRSTLAKSFGKHVHRNPIGALPVVELYADPHLIQLWIKDMRENGLASSTARVVALSLSSVLNFAHAKEIIPNNPIRNSPLVTIPSPSRKTVVPYTSEQLDGIRQHLRAKYRIVLEAGSSAGLRIGEVYGLSPDDIQGKDLHIRRQVRSNDSSKNCSLVFALPKGGKTRVVPLPDSLASFLEGLPTTLVTLPWDKVSGKPVTVRVYMAEHGKLFDSSALSRAWVKALRLAGIMRVPYADRFHRLRHTYASRLLQRKVDIRSLAYYLGHDDPGFTLRRYCHFMIGDGEDVRRAIDGDVPPL